MIKLKCVMCCSFLVIEESLYPLIMRRFYFQFSLIYITKNSMCYSFLVIEESLHPLIMRIF
jgi:hypothetical protein